MRIYLDHNATTPVDPAAAAAMARALTDLFGNPSSVHYYGQQAKAALDDARSAVAALMYLTQEHNLKFHKLQAIFSLLPPIQRLEAVVGRLLLCGFALLTLGLAVGFLCQCTDRHYRCLIGAV